MDAPVDVILDAQTRAQVAKDAIPHARLSVQLAVLGAERLVPADAVRRVLVLAMAVQDAVSNARPVVVHPVTEGVIPHALELVVPLVNPDVLELAPVLAQILVKTHAPDVIAHAPEHAQVPALAHAQDAQVVQAHVKEVAREHAADHVLVNVLDAQQHAELDAVLVVMQHAAVRAQVVLVNALDVHDAQDALKLVVVDAVDNAMEHALTDALDAPGDAEDSAQVALVAPVLAQAHALMDAPHLVVVAPVVPDVAKAVLVAA